MGSWRRMILGTGLALAALACAAQDCAYRVGMREYPHLYQRNAAGRYAGIDKEFFDTLGERSGCRFTLLVESQPRLWKKLALGELDMASWVVPSDQRAAVVKVIPLVSGRMMALTWRDAGIRSEADFLAAPVLHAVAVRQTLYGAGYDGLLQQLRTQGRVSEVADFDTALRAFSGRRVALMFVHPWALASQPADWLAQVQMADWHAAAPGLVSGLALSHKTVREADAQRIEQALRTMRQDGSLGRMLGRHLPMEMVTLLP